MARWIGVSVSIFAFLMIGAASASEPQPAAANVKATQDSPAVHEDLPDETSQQLGMARQSFLTVDLGAAATRLRKAAANLRLTSNHADEATQPQLNRSAEELESLSHQVESGKVKTVEELDKPSARALHRLSRHHYVMAQRSWLQKQRERTGKHLRASADNLEHAAQLGGQELQVASHTVVKDVRLISGKLVNGVGYGVDEVGIGLERLGKQVETVGNGIEPNHKTILRTK